MPSAPALLDQAAQAFTQLIRGQPALGRIPVALRVRGRVSERLSVEARACFGSRPLRAIREAESVLAPARSGGLDRALIVFLDEHFSERRKARRPDE